MNRPQSRFFGSVWWKILLVFLALHSSADAHLTVQGIGEVQSGALHPLMTPAHVLVLLGLALCLGQRYPLNLKVPLAVFSIAAAAGLLLTLTVSIGSTLPLILIGLALVFASIAALGKPTPPWLAGLLCAIAAITVGLDSKVDTGTTKQILKTLAGTWITMNLVVLYFAAVTANGEQKLWVRTAARIVGAWIIAIAVMMLAFALRKVP